MVRAGREYEVPPAPANPIKMERDEFDAALMGSERDAVRTLAMDVNLGGIYGEEVCAVCGIEKDRACDTLPGPAGVYEKGCGSEGVYV